jgi:hypothetical protein
MKDDIKRFIAIFHRNGKLSKCINYTFIALIPKVGSGAASCGIGRRRWWENFGVYFLILFCFLTFQINGYGGMMLVAVTT